MKKKEQKPLYLEFKKKTLIKNIDGNVNYN